MAGCFGGFLMGACWPAFSVFFGEVLLTFSEEHGEDLKKRTTDISYAMYILGGAAGVISITTNFLLKYAGEYLGQRIRHISFSAMLRQEIGWFDRKSNQVGSLTSRLANDASRIKMATGAPLASLTNAFSAVVLSIAVSLWAGWQFGLLMVGMMPLQTLAGFIQSFGTNTYALQAAGSVEESGKIASEAVDKIRIVASLCKEDFFLDKYMGLFDAQKKDGVRRSMFIGGSWGGFNLISGIVYMTALSVGFVFVYENWITFDAIFTILFCVMLSSLEVGRANAFVPEITAGRAAATKMFRLLERESLINPNDSSGITPDACLGEVAVSNVDFYYPTRLDMKALKGLSISAERGQSIAMVGPSGGGKTTVIQLIERFYDVRSGNVRIDGRSIETLNIQWLRRQMALVTQDPILFSFSLRENIAYGDNKRKVSMEEIIEAAKCANIHDFISKLPQGYDTTVGSKGSQLSG
jgi:ABC-type multidrug transport system fused ATPase/permease subunit